ncbi:MAG: HAMP domain-containing sensor histidine kinase [Thermoanaerobaculia bacterium]
MLRGPRSLVLASLGEQLSATAIVWIVVAAGSGLAHLRLDPVQFSSLRQVWILASLVGLAILAGLVLLLTRVIVPGSPSLLLLPRQVAIGVTAISFGTFAIPALAGVLLAGFPTAEGIKVVSVGTAAALACGIASYYLAARRFFRRPLAGLPDTRLPIGFPLSKKIAALGFTLVLACFCILGTAAYTSMEQESERIARDLLRLRVDRVLQRLRSGPSPAAEGWRNLLANELALFPLVHVEVWDGVGNVVAAAGPSSKLRPDLNAGWSGNDRYEILTAFDIDLVRHVGHPIAIHSRTLAGQATRLVASIRVVDADDYNSRALRLIGFSAASLFALATILSILAAIAISSPVLALSENLRSFSARPLGTPVMAPTGDDELAGLSGAFEEMATRIETQTRLLSRATLEWERTFDALPSVLYLLDDRGCVVRANRSLPELFSRSFGEILGLPAIKLGLPHDITVRPEVRIIELFPDLVFRYLGMPFPIAGERPASLHFLENVTESERLRQRAISAERQSAVGELVGRVAHEVRNPLFGISAATRVLRDSFEDGTEMGPALEHIEREVKRLAVLMEGLLDLRRPTTRVRTSRSIEGVLREASASARLRHGDRDVRIDLLLRPDLPLLEIDEVRIAQVIGNLLDNSILSAPKSCVQIGAWPDGEHVVVEIGDDGPGLSDEARRRAFEPFFSTRVGGSGLGLRIAQQTMKEHGGRILISASPLGGALISLQFPLPPGARDAAGAART